jgi:hypothetical protein
MELTETISSLNRQLIDLFGIDTVTGKAIWRIVWSEEQFEKRLMDVTDEGLDLLYPQVREVPKYRQWIKERYVLERLVLVSDDSRKELAGLKQSYEPLYVFMNKDGDYLPPRLDVAQLVIDTVYAAQGKSSLAKYKDPEFDKDLSLEMKIKKIEEIEEYLYGNETEVSDSLNRHEGVVVPPNYTTQKEN